LSPNNRYFAWINTKLKLKVADWRSGKVVQETQLDEAAKGSSAPAGFLRWSPEGDQVLEFRNRVGDFDGRTGEFRPRQKASDLRLRPEIEIGDWVTFPPDGSTFLAIQAKAKPPVLALFDAATGQPLRELPQQSPTPYANAATRIADSAPGRAWASLNAGAY